ncbi:MAG: hypothetical protein C0608_04395 [Deltaproteobacteria bacterium]|nr:MAG: hypothetical protein C0608_04395 [Deltaproteobacteria bacterium]
MKLKRAKYLIYAVAAFMMTMPLAGCGSSSSSSTGTISLSITDAPVDDAMEVYLTFTSFTLLGVEGTADAGPYEIPLQYQGVNLMDYQGNDHAALVTGLEVPVGNYKVRLDADLTFTPDSQMSWISFDAASQRCTEAPVGEVVFDEASGTCRFPLVIPSEEESWFKPKGDVTITAGGSSAFTIEFDLRKNVVDPSNEDVAFKLKPTGLRLVNDTVVGSIEGAVDTALLETECAEATPVVYLYGRAGAVDEFIPDDIHPDNLSYITSVPVLMDSPTTYGYKVGFVLPGEYGVALLCAEDDPETDEDLTFLAAVDGVTVIANKVTYQDLPPASN